MIDLSKYKCPHCGYKRDNYAVGNKAICGTCGISVEGPDPDDERYTGDAIFIRLSEAIHGKPHDGETINIRGMVVLLEGEGWVLAGAFDPEGPNPSDDEMYKELERGLLPMKIIGKHIITATIPVPVAQEIKGRIENG